MLQAYPYFELLEFTHFFFLLEGGQSEKRWTFIAQCPRLVWSLIRRMELMTGHDSGSFTLSLHDQLL